MECKNLSVDIMCDRRFAQTAKDQLRQIQRKDPKTTVKYSDLSSQNGFASVAMGGFVNIDTTDFSGLLVESVREFGRQRTAELAHIDTAGNYQVIKRRMLVSISDAMAA